VTPEELELIDDAAEVVENCSYDFGAAFYTTLFELSPHTRALFPEDLSVQQGKVVDELAFLIEAARDLDTFVDRARDLGRRHGDCMGDGWTDAHEAAWTKLYVLIANVMREGATDSLFVDS
jgi:hemoglobin-like flavoprotein